MRGAPFNQTRIGAFVRLGLAVAVIWMIALPTAQGNIMGRIMHKIETIRNCPSKDRVLACMWPRVDLNNDGILDDHELTIAYNKYHPPLFGVKDAHEYCGYGPDKIIRLSIVRHLKTCDTACVNRILIAEILKCQLD